MKEWEKESFIALFLIDAYPWLPGTTGLFIATRAFCLGTTFQHMRLRKQTNMTQPAELDWSCHAITNAWLGNFEILILPLWLSIQRFLKVTFNWVPFFFIFNNVAQYNRFNFISSYGRKQPPNNGRRTGGEKWVSSYRWEKATGKDFVMVILYCLLIKHTLILVFNFLDHFDLNVLRNPLNTPVLER